MGQCISPDDAYLAMRGIRTMGVRLKQHEKSSIKVAKWLEAHPLVDHVRHPALASCPGHEFYQRDFKGCNGLFSFVLKQSDSKATTALLDGMTHFSMGYSWGGFESLILANEPRSFNALRTIANPNFEGTLIRVHIGLEDVEDLIHDLDEGLQRYQDALN